MRGLSLVAVSGGHSSSWCAGISLSQPLLLRSTGSRRAGSVAVAHGPSCSAACGILPDQDSNPCPLHWQADSQPLCHQGSPIHSFLNILFHYGLPQETGYSSLCFTVGPCCLSILHVIVCIYQPQIPRPSLSLSVFFFWPHPAACRTSPTTVPPAVEGQSLNHCTTREALPLAFKSS